MTGDEVAEPIDRDQERKRIAELLTNHAPPDWEERFEREGLLDAIIDTTPLQMFVMAADIRESTLLMKEAVHFEQFAKIMDKFVSAVRSGIGAPGAAGVDDVGVGVEGELAGAQRAGMNTLKGKVTRRSFVGAQTDYVVDVNGTALRVISSSRDARYQPSQDVLLSFAPADCLLLES